MKITKTIHWNWNIGEYKYAALEASWQMYMSW
jgi:hypothetical protein